MVLGCIFIVCPPLSQPGLLYQGAFFSHLVFHHHYLWDWNAGESLLPTHF